MAIPQIILIDNKESMCNEWRDALALRGLQEKVEVVQMSVEDYLATTPVSSFALFADSFGLMEERICDLLDNQAKECVRSYLLSIWFGEMPLSASCGVQINTSLPACIYTAQTHFPRLFEGADTLYHSVRSTLICAIHNSVPSILIPVPGSAKGNMNEDDIARVMVNAIAQLYNAPTEVSLAYAKEHKNID